MTPINDQTMADRGAFQHTPPFPLAWKLAGGVTILIALTVAAFLAFASDAPPAPAKPAASGPRFHGAAAGVTLPTPPPPPKPAPVKPRPAPAAAPPKPPPVAKPLVPPPPPPVVLAPPKPAPAPLAPGAAAPAAPKEDPRLKRRLAGFGGGGQAAPAAGATNTGGGGGTLDLSVTKTATARATRLSDLTFTVPQGTFINCSLDVAIQSDQPGFVSCTLTEDVFGADGSVVLLDRGSRVVGEYKPQTLTTGKSRIYVVWGRIRTPTGVLVDLDSPGTGPLGRGGMGGYIDKHYWERIGVPVLISIVTDTVTNLTRDSQNYYQNTESQGRSALNQIMQDYAAIRPTLHKNQGESISIIVSRDLDMSAVYRLKQVRVGTLR